MKNVTVSFDDETYRRSQMKAASRGQSMSRYLATLVEQDNREIDDASEELRRNRRLAALNRYLSGPKLAISENGRMPTAEERNARR